MPSSRPNRSATRARSGTGEPRWDSSAGGVTGSEAGETYDGSPAAEEFARRTGVLPGLGEVFNFGIVSMRQLNDSLLFDSRWVRSVTHSSRVGCAPS
ncbi:MAG: hypothetical protein R2789_07325 [Microthrixaceae bacterium]